VCQSVPATGSRKPPPMAAAAGLRRRTRRYAGTVPPLNQSRSGGFRYRSLPVWLQWVLPFGVGAALVVAVVLFVHHQTDDVPLIAKVTNPQAIAEQNREDHIIVVQQQAPHVAKLKPGVAPSAGLRAAVVGYMTYQINHGEMDGPIKRASCRSVTGGTIARQVMRCEVTATDLNYPFDGVVQPAAGVITYCQRVEPPVPSMNIPVSKRCT
jgi:hypothetical protein